MLRANALSEDLDVLKLKLNESQPENKDFKDKISDLNHACFLKDLHKTQLDKKLDELKEELTFYQEKLYKEGQTPQTIFLN